MVKSVVFLVFIGIVAQHTVLAQDSTYSSDVGSDNAGARATNGLLMLGPDPRPCDESLEGHIRYNSADKQPEFCDGSAWQSWSASK